MATMLDCGSDVDATLGRLATLARNRYYYGKLLDAPHLELESDYNNRKRWLLNRLSLGGGVLCGLSVSASADGTTVQVSPGVAIDGYGREIIVPAPSPAVDPHQPTDDCGQPAGGPVAAGSTVTLYLCYHECQAEPAPALVSDCPGDQRCENGIVRERYRLRIAAGTPPPPGDLSDRECVDIFGGPPPANETRRQVICGLLSGACTLPAESCVVLATITLDANGKVVTVDNCQFRTTVYSNAVLLDLILCLAERVDQCCGGGSVPVVKALAIVSGDNQAGATGQALPKPLVVQVTDSGNPVANEPVTFTVATGGGGVGATAAGAGPTFVVSTIADGTATAPVWVLGGTVGSQTVTAAIASGSPSSVTFRAGAKNVPVRLPTIQAIWPPEAKLLTPGAAGGPNSQQWYGIWVKSPHLELTFNVPMDVAALTAPAGWLGLFRIEQKSLVGTTAGPTVTTTITRVPLTYAGAVAAPILGVAGSTAQYAMDPKYAKANALVQFLVVINAQAGTITDTQATPRTLDADFAGTTLTPAEITILWGLQVGVPVTTPGATIPATLINATVSLPSGDGTEGGLCTSWFAVRQG